MVFPCYHFNRKLTYRPLKNLLYLKDMSFAKFDSNFLIGIKAVGCIVEYGAAFAPEINHDVPTTT